MEKKYCTHCIRIANLDEMCEGCGKSEFQRIIISVQAFKRFNKEMPKQQSDFVNALSKAYRNFYYLDCYLL